MEKSDFQNYRILLKEVKQIQEQLTALESSIYSPRGQRFSSTPRAASGPKNTMDDVVLGHIKLEDFYREQLSKKEAKQLAIEQAIASLEDNAQRVIMRERYINGKSWSRVCMELEREGYSERQVYRLHGFALLNLKEVV